MIDSILGDNQAWVIKQLEIIKQDEFLIKDGSCLTEKEFACLQNFEVKSSNFTVCQSYIYVQYQMCHI